MERSNIKYRSVEVVYVDNSGAERRYPIAKAISSNDAISQFKEFTANAYKALRVETSSASQGPASIIWENR